MEFIDPEQITIRLEEEERVALRKTIVVLDEIKKWLSKFSNSYLYCEDDKVITSYHNFLELDDAAILLDNISTKDLYLRKEKND